MITNLKKKRKELRDVVIGTLDRLDKTKLNSKRWAEFLDKMSDKEFERWITAFLKDDQENFYMEILPFKNEPVLEDIVDAAKFLKVPLDEYAYLRHDGNADDPVRTATKCPVGYINLRRLQQMLDKKNSFSVDIDTRNLKTNQLTGDDKVARITEAENYALTVYEADKAMKEFLGCRADDDVNRSQLYSQIAQYGYCRLEDLEDDVKNKVTLNTVDVFLLGSGIKSDLITPGLELRRTIEAKNVRKTNVDKQGKIGRE